MLKVGLSTGRDERALTEPFLASLQEAGIAGIEVSNAYLDISMTEDYKYLPALAEKYSIALWSYHMPFAPFDRIDPSHKDHADFTVKAFSELIKMKSELGFRRVIIHPSGEPIADDDRAERMKIAKDSFARLAGVAAACDMQIAVEDLPRTCLCRNSAEMLDLLSADPSLRTCFDTNHLLSEDPADFVRKVGNKIVTTHVSDCDFLNERHWYPGEGKIDWPALMRALEEVGYQGPFIYEIGLLASEYHRALTPADLVNTAHEIFAHKTPTRILP